MNTESNYRYSLLFYFVALFCFLHGIAIFGQAKDFPLTMENLTARKLGVQVVIGWQSIEFAKDGTYQFSYFSDGMGGVDEGAFTIVDSRIQLKPQHCKGNSCWRFALGRAICRVVATPESLYYRQSLICKSEPGQQLQDNGEYTVTLPFPQTKVSQGTKRVFNGTSIITLGESKGTTTSSVHIRNAPERVAQAVDYIPDLGQNSISSVPPGTTVIVIARTEKKEHVNNWNNYWYLVNVGLNQEVWMFAEFVKLDK